MPKAVPPERNFLKNCRACIRDSLRLFCNRLKSEGLVLSLATCVLVFLLNKMKKVTTLQVRDSDAAYADLRKRIIDCDIEPGANVSEPMLTELLGVQRSAVRAALIKLGHDGLVRPVPRQGYEVASLTVEDALDLVEMRSLAEPRAAFFAAGKMPLEQLDSAEALFRKGFDPKDEVAMTAFLHSSRKFKVAIVMATHNATLAHTIYEVSERFDRYLRMQFKADRGQGWQMSGNESALKLIAALRAGNAELSASEMRAIVRGVGTAIIGELLTSQLPPARYITSNETYVQDILAPRLMVV